MTELIDTFDATKAEQLDKSARAQAEIVRLLQVAYISLHLPTSPCISL